MLPIHEFLQYLSVWYSINSILFLVMILPKPSDFFSHPFVQEHPVWNLILVVHIMVPVLVFALGRSALRALQNSRS